MNRSYIAIDLKSFYASVECVERGLDPLKTNLVVADKSRSEKTICLAVSPSLKAYGISGRARLFEVVSKVKEVNNRRRIAAGIDEFSGKSYLADELDNDKSLEIDYIAAPPRMAYYMSYSTKIYEIYMRYVAPEDISVYSVDEVFIDVTHYLNTYKMTAHELAMKMIREVLKETGITATAGIGTNLYLAKIAMDVVAKHIPADKDGVRIAELDEMSYRRTLWCHKPITDFWRVGRGTAKRLYSQGIYTMGDIARCSLGSRDEYYNEDLLYKMFGVNAEFLIDHAWGYEPCTIEDIRAYKPQNSSLSSGQVLTCPYTAGKARLVVHEMADLFSLELVEKRMVIDQIVLNVTYDIDNLKYSEFSDNYNGEIKTDYYGRKIPKDAHGSINLGGYTSSTKKIIEKTLELYDEIVNKKLLVRKLNLSGNHVLPESEVKEEKVFEQLDLFTDYAALEKQREEEKKDAKKERQMQEALLEIKKKFGKNAVLKGMNLEEGATARERNSQIGGHKA